MTPLEELLQCLRGHVARAEFAAAAALAPQIEAALARLPAPPDPAALRRLKTMAERNDALIAAARRGIHAARRRMEEIRRAAHGVQTYDGQGRRTDIVLSGRMAGRF